MKKINIGNKRNYNSSLLVLKSLNLCYIINRAINFLSTRIVEILIINLKMNQLWKRRKKPARQGIKKS